MIFPFLSAVISGMPLARYSAVSLRVARFMARLASLPCSDIRLSGMPSSVIFLISGICLRLFVKSDISLLFVVTKAFSLLDRMCDVDSESLVKKSWCKEFQDRK